MFGLGSAERMADIGEMPDCLVAAGSSFKFHSFFMKAKKSVSWQAARKKLAGEERVSTFADCFKSWF